MDNKPKRFTLRPEGTMQLTTAADGSVHSSSDQPIHIDLGHIVTLGGCNLSTSTARNYSRTDYDYIGTAPQLVLEDALRVNPHGRPRRFDIELLNQYN